MFIIKLYNQVQKQLTYSLQGQANWTIYQIFIIIEQLFHNFQIDYIKSTIIYFIQRCHIFEEGYFRKWKVNNSIYIHQYKLTLLIFLTMLVLTLFTLIISVQAINLTVTSSTKYRVYGMTSGITVLTACDFDSNWAVMTNTYLPNYNQLEYKVVANNSTNFTGSMPGSSYAIKARGHTNNTTLNQTYFLINTQNKLLIYRSASLSSITRTQNNVTDAAFAVSNAELYWIKNSTKQIRKYNVLNNTILKSITLSGRNLAQIQYSTGWVVLYSQNMTNLTQGYFTLYDDNLNIIRQLQVIYGQLIDSTLASINTYFKYNHTIDIHPVENIIMRSYGNIIQVWDLSNSVSRVRTINTKQQVYAAVKCGAIAVVLYNSTIGFYQFQTWAMVANKNIYTFVVGYLKCLPDISAVGVYYPLVSPSITVYYLNIKNYTNSSTINTSTNSSTVSNITNTSTLNNNMSNVTSNTVQNNSNSVPISINITLNNSYIPGVIPVINQSTPIISNKSVLGQQLQQVFNSPQFTTSTQTLAQAMSIASSANLGSSLMRPLAYFFEQLLFYSYHRRVYPQIVQMICSQFDMLTYLRLNPSFLNINIQINYLTQTDTLMKEQSDYIANRVPNSLFFTQTITQQYLDNVIMAIGSYLAILLLAKITLKLSNYYPRLQRIHHFFFIRSIWWNLLIMVLSFNIRGFSYYCYAQLQLAYSLDPLSKLNLLFTIAVLALAFTFTFSFYFIVFRFQKPELSKQVLQISKFSMQSYCMQMGLQCIRSFLQGFTHAALTRNHQLQVIGLLFIDILTLVFAFQFRSYFNNRLTYYLIFCYSVFFVVWEIFICLYVFDALTDFDYNFTFMVIVGCLSATAILRMLYGIVLQIVEIFRSFCPKTGHEEHQDMFLRDNGNKVCNLDLVDWETNKFNKQIQHKKECSIQKTQNQQANSKVSQVQSKISKTKKKIKIINKFDQPNRIELRKGVKSDKQIPQYVKKKHEMQLKEVQTFKIIDLKPKFGHQKTDSRIELNACSGVQLPSGMGFGNSQHNVAATSTSIKLRRNAVTVHHR